MKGKQNFKLIDGTFTASEASRVLLNLVGSKINYHTMENFSNQERFGKDLSKSVTRIKSLKKLQGSLKEVFDFAEKEGLNLKIDGLIEITIIDK